MNHFRSMAWLALLVCVVSAPIAANAQDSWLTVTLPADGCQWTGSLDLQQPVPSSGCSASFAGSMTLTRVAGASPECPPVLSGPVSGTLSGSTINFGLVSTEFGTINFTGALDAGGQTATGTWSGPPGSGQWFLASDVELGGGSAQMTVRRPADGCQWTGPITAAGGITFTGSMALTRVAGAATCPATVSGPLSGILFGSALCFELVSTDFGNATFVGTINASSRSAMGTWSGDPGSGTWWATIRLGITRLMRARPVR